jgi:hypothetical protein
VIAPIDWNFQRSCFLILGLRLLASASLAAAEDAFLFSKKRSFWSNGGELKERRGRKLIFAGPVQAEQPDGTSSSYLNIELWSSQIVCTNRSFFFFQPKGKMIINLR